MENELIELAQSSPVQTAAGFPAAAAELSGEQLAEMFESLRRSAASAPGPLLHHDGLLARAPRAPRPEHLPIAIVNYCSDQSTGIELPGGNSLEFLDYDVRLTDDDGVRPADLLGLTAGDRLAIGHVRYLAAAAPRGATRDTPLRSLIEGLTACALVSAQLDSIRAQVQEKTGREVANEVPSLYIIATPRYWELCRKRGAQKGAAWIAELERLTHEIDDHIGVHVGFVALGLEGEPPWTCEDRRPQLAGSPSATSAWEAGAGKLKPRARARTRDAAPLVVEADPDRPARPYSMRETFEIGDTVRHKSLGEGVVQRVLGPSKIEVRFGETNRTLVQGRV